MLCAVLERCQALEVGYIQTAILDVSIWSNAFNVYLEKSDSAKGKSVRQVLITLTGILLRNQNERAIELQDRAISNLVDIICQRQDRGKVKPALQVLAHFLHKDIATISKLVQVHAKISSASTLGTDGAGIRRLFATFLSWVVYHDTALSAGHLIKHFLAQLRRNVTQDALGFHESIVSVWIKPVIECLHQWPDRIQAFKTHVFPHCFLPNLDEFVHFLSSLHFSHHAGTTKPIPEALRAHITKKNELEEPEEFRILLASLETGKELNIVEDVGKSCIST